MLGRATQSIFTKVFVFLIMTIYFWAYSLLGLVVLGVGPALRTVSELYQAHQWQWRDYSFKQGFKQWRQDFWTVNAHTWLFMGVLAILGYNLYLSVQLRELWVVFVQFIIVAAMVLVFCLGVFTLMLRTHYEVSFKDAVKLALVQFFASFGQMLIFVVMTVAVVAISLKWPGLILFLSVGVYLALADHLSQQMYTRIDAELAQ